MVYQLSYSTSDLKWVYQLSYLISDFKWVNQLSYSISNKYFVMFTLLFFYFLKSV